MSRVVDSPKYPNTYALRSVFGLIFDLYENRFNTVLACRLDYEGEWRDVDSLPLFWKIFRIGKN
jgi:hypothetical protein